mmetsp:Transcript_14182/g.31669  ORF Transcript_14182/g.31669 Transcript_14182/m.31669 type:complete len:206 (-) Transcript_14182:994-1611(-)
MEWLQGHDEKAGDFGYRTRDMAVRSYLIHKELMDLRDGWEANPNWADFVSEAKALSNQNTRTDSAADAEGPQHVAAATNATNDADAATDPTSETATDEAANATAEPAGAPDQDQDTDDDNITEEGFFRRSSDQYSYEDIKEEISLFFSIAIEMSTKHFALYAGPLVHFGLAGEKESATAIARILAEKQVDGSYLSSTHGCTTQVR